MLATPFTIIFSLFSIIGLIQANVNRAAENDGTHRHQQQLTNSISSTNEQHLRHSQGAETGGEGMIEDESNGSSINPATSEGRKDIFHEFLSRGMFNCATKYVALLQKLNKMIVVSKGEKEAFKNFSRISGCPSGIWPMQE
jgi:hypothetical protein